MIVTTFSCLDVIFKSAEIKSFDIALYKLKAFLYCRSTNVDLNLTLLHAILKNTYEGNDVENELDMIYVYVTKPIIVLYQIKLVPFGTQECLEHTMFPFLLYSQMFAV